MLGEVVGKVVIPVETTELALVPVVVGVVATVVVVVGICGRFGAGGLSGLSSRSFMGSSGGSVGRVVFEVEVIRPVVVVVDTKVEPVVASVVLSDALL